MASDAEIVGERPPQVFISYRRVDDDTPDGSKKAKGFVKKLHDDLRFQLQQRGLPSPWLDRIRLDQADQFNAVIRDAVTNSDLFLAIVSNNYIQSDYCTLELATFLERLDRLPETEQVRRIFRVDKHIVPVDKIPERLREVKAAEFFLKDEKGRDETLYSPGRSPAIIDKKKYDEAIRDLAYAIYARLQKIIVTPPPESGGGEEPPEPYPEVENGPHSPKRTVYIAKPGSDMYNEYRTLVKELSGRGYNVVPDPESDLPRDGENAVSVIRQALAAAETSIHLVGTRQGFIPDELRDGIVPLQLIEAKTEAAQRSGFERLIWIPKLPPMVEQASNEPRAPFDVLEGFGGYFRGWADGKGADTVESDTASRFNDFVLQRLKSRAIAPPPGRKACVYVGALTVDRALGNAMALHVKSMGAAPVFGPTTLLERADHIIYCWGRGDETSMFDALASPAIEMWQKNHPAGCLCLVVHSPESETKSSAIEIGSWSTADCVLDRDADDFETQLRTLIMRK